MGPSILSDEAYRSTCESPLVHEMPAQLLKLDAAIMGVLACPACHGDLRVEAGHLECVECRRRFPVVDGIPALITERVETDR